jgi:hypothetical protein
MVGSRFTLEIPLPPLDRKGETKTARRERIDAIEALVPHIFTIAAFHFGDVEARKLFNTAAKKKRGSARNDAELLRMHDAEVAKHPKKRRSSVPRMLAKRLYSEEGKKFGKSADAIRKRISRLLKTRSDREEAAARHWEAFRDKTSAKNDAELLRMHDAEVAKHPKRRRSSVPRILAERLYSDEGNKFGNSAYAIRKHISRLLKTRSDREEATARQWEAFRDKDGNYPGLLGNWAAELLKKQSSTNEGDGQN